MGIENRGYMSTGSADFRGYGRMRDGWTMVTILIVINVVVFLFQTMNFQTRLLESWLALDLKSMLRGQIWRLTTYDFLHETSDGLPLHLLFNMWLLYLAGRRVESKYGSSEFLAFYLLAGILSGVVFLLWGIITHVDVPAIGASGAAVAVMIVYALNWPNERWYIWGILPMPVIVLAGLSALFDIWPMIQQLSGRPGAGGGIAHAAHVGGMLFGLMYVKFDWNLTGLWSQRSRFSLKKALRRRPQLRVHHPEIEQEPSQTDIPRDVEIRLDRLLEKISQHGEASLTDEERRFLTEASRRYRNRL